MRNHISIVCEGDMRRSFRAGLLIAGIAIISLLNAGCFLNNNSGRPAPIEGRPSGTARAQAVGFHGTKTITVEITVKKGFITEAKVSGPDETAGIGKVAVERAADAIIKKNSAEIDTIASASITSDGIRSACREAIEKIKAAN